MAKQYPGYTLQGPTTGNPGEPLTFTVAKYPAGDSNYSGNVYLYVNDVGTGQVTLEDGTPSGTFTFTPPADGTYTIRGNHGNQVWLDAPPITVVVGNPTPPPKVNPMDELNAKIDEAIAAMNTATVLIADLKARPALEAVKALADKIAAATQAFAEALK